MSISDQIRKPYERSRLILVWVAIQEKFKEENFLKFPSSTPIENNEYTEFPESIERYDNFSRYAVILDETYGRLIIYLSNPNLFETYKDNFREAYNKIYGSQLHESSGTILQIADCIPKKVESEFFSKTFDPVPERGLVIREYKVDGFQARIVYSEFLSWAWLKDEDIMGWYSRKVHGIHSDNG